MSLNAKDAALLEMHSHCFGHFSTLRNVFFREMFEKSA